MRTQLCFVVFLSGVICGLPARAADASEPSGKLKAVITRPQPTSPTIECGPRPAKLQSLSVAADYRTRDPRSSEQTVISHCRYLAHYFPETAFVLTSRPGPTNQRS